MLKFLALALLIIGVIAFFVLRQTPKRPPRDWRRGGDDGGPVLPTTQIGLDAGRKPANDSAPGDSHDKVTSDMGTSGIDGGGDGGGGGGGGGD